MLLCSKTQNKTGKHTLHFSLYLSEGRWSWGLFIKKTRLRIRVLTNYWKLNEEGYFVDSDILLNTSLDLLDLTQQSNFRSVMRWITCNVMDNMQTFAKLETVNAVFLCLHFRNKLSCIKNFRGVIHWNNLEKFVYRNEKPAVKL
jgi:hypothetical protein